VRLALLAAALAVAAARPAAATAPPALDAVAAALTREVGPPAEGRRALLLAVDARAPALANALETALTGALSTAGYAVVPARGGVDAEGRARALGQDWLLRVQAGLVPGRRELAAVGELIPAWASFFLQRQPEARAIPPRVVNARAAADPETLLLAREPGSSGAPLSVRRLARVPGRVLALAVGEPAEPGRTAVVAVTDTAVLVLGALGEQLAERTGAGLELRPVRAAAAVVAVGDFGGGRIALRRAGAPRGEVLAVAGERLQPAGTLDAAPLCAGDAGRLFGAFEPGTGVLRDRLSALVDDGPARSARTLYGAACAPRGGPVAHAVLGTDLTVELLGPDLDPVPAPAPLSTGCGFALGDVDGDGAAELVASSADPSAPEVIRVVAPLSGRTLSVAAARIPGPLVAGAAGDLTGDGVDDAVLAAVVDGGAATELLLVTSDPREPQ
jgi:hypothetical protein